MAAAGTSAVSCQLREAERHDSASALLLPSPNTSLPARREAIKLGFLTPALVAGHRSPACNSLLELDDNPYIAIVQLIVRPVPPTYALLGGLTRSAQVLQTSRNRLRGRPYRCTLGELLDPQKGGSRWGAASRSHAVAACLAKDSQRIAASRPRVCRPSPVAATRPPPVLLLYPAFPAQAGFTWPEVHCPRLLTSHLP